MFAEQRPITPLVPHDQQDDLYHLPHQRRKEGASATEWIGRIKALFAPSPRPHASASGYPSPAAMAAFPTPRGSPPQRLSAKRSAVLHRLDMPRRIGWGEAARVVQGEGLGKSGFWQAGFQTRLQRLK
jgi:hypothetical protein